MTLHSLYAIMEKGDFMSRKTAATILICISVVCIILGLVFLGVGFNKITAYRSPDYGAGINAYVGGDAYNYIINGTYFTGYAVIGMGCFIISAITLLGAFIFLTRRNDNAQSMLPQKRNDLPPI